MGLKDAALREPQCLLHYPHLFFKLKKNKMNLFRSLSVFRPAFLFTHPGGVFGRWVEIPLMVSLVHRWRKRLIRFWW